MSAIIESYDPLINIDEVGEESGLGRSTIYQLMKNGEFPKPIKLTSKIRRWQQSKVRGWVISRIAASQQLEV